MKDSNRDILVLGAGGHARVLLHALREAGASVLGCLDPDRSLWKKIHEGVPVLGGDDLLNSYDPDSVDLVNGIGSPIRRQVFARLAAQRYRFPPVLSRSAFCAASAAIGDGTQVLTKAVVHPGAHVGRNVVINTAAVIEHDCSIGDDAFIAPGVILCGQVRIGRRAMIGAGAVVLEGREIGDDAIVGAGAIVTRNVLSETTCWGVPARKIR